MGKNQMTADNFEALNEIQKANVCGMISEFETHNSFTKGCLVAALRWSSKDMINEQELKTKDTEKLQKLIDKNTPKKPIVEYGYYDECGVCGKALHDRFNVNYCGHCGQKIDRSGGE